ncbi:hypothetical protein FRC10_004390 [Ceratobasidium sp. 414]|nr:hypothetical protein FRC10_004390 [Ceratobasidium sp. 414]
MDPEAFISGWQLESTSANKTICRDNIKDWLLWGFFSAGPESLFEPHVADEIEEYLQILEAAIGRTIPPGRNKGIKSIRLSFDDVVVYHRPFVWYMIVLLVDALVAAWLKWSGFKHYTASQPIFPPRIHTLFSETSSSKTLSYWYRPPSASEVHEPAGRFTPLLFLHGIGIGLFPYVPLLRGYSKKHPDVPIIVPEILSISSRLTLPPPSQEEFLGAIRDIFEHHGIREYSITAHSYGTALAAGIVRLTNRSSPMNNNLASTTSGVARSEHTSSLFPPQSLTLLDPICLLLHLPSVARNFLYRPPRQANEHELYYFACTDPGVAHALSRHFFWTQNILWKEDLALVGLADQSVPRVAVVLSGNDIIVNTHAVWAYLTGLPPPENQCGKPWPFVPPTPHPESFVPVSCAASPNVLAVYLGGLDHAQMFLSSAGWRGVLGVIEEVSAIATG